jgi:kinesin family protein 4/21/27
LQAHIHDLEAKLKAYTDKGDTHSEAMAELHKDISKLKETNSTLQQHTSHLEARLDKSEAHTVGLLAQIERHERDAEKREAAYRDLEEHINLLDTSKDNKLLLAELEQRDLKIVELEKQLEVSSDAASKERAGEAVAGESLVQIQLRDQLAALQATPTSKSEPRSTPLRSAATMLREVKLPESPPPTDEDTDVDDPENEVAHLRRMLEELSARCSAAESRYTEAEGKVVDLTTQLSELREMDDVVPFSPAPGSSSNGDETSDNGSTSTLQTPKTHSPTTSPKSSRRGSMPLLNNGAAAVKTRDFRGGRGYGEYKRSRRVHRGTMRLPGLTRTQATIAIAGAVVSIIVGLLVKSFLERS